MTTACVPVPACACPPVSVGSRIMSRFAVPVGFTLAAVWVMVVFVLVSGR